MVLGLFFLSGILLAVMNALGIYFHLYWYYPWFDLVTHTLGGLFVVLSVGVSAQFKWLPTRMQRCPMFFFGTLAIVMASWEWYEYYFGISDATDPGFLLDTTLDVIMGTLGGVFGYLVVRMSRVAEIEL